MSALRGMMSSFSSSLRTSAIGCSSPRGPTRFGPGRHCIQAWTFRSSSVM
ncbi:MAG TPA: hypothetical protein PKG80_07370 [Acidobacteriota bacterium]|nr:hypothetical protein [Acidobacteriota bacterium]